MTSRRRPTTHWSGIAGMLLAGSLSGGASLAEAGAPEPHDPLLGIDSDGRIPYVERPADLPNSSRWRYIPAGRIKDGSMLERLFVTSFVAPYVFRFTDAGWGGGFGIGDIDFRNQRRREMAVIFGSYSAEQQQNYGMFWRRMLHSLDLPGGGVLQEERSFLRARAGYSKTRTRRFFGLGAESQTRSESSYSDDLWLIDLGFHLALPDPGSNWILSGGARMELHELAEGIVKGVPNTEEAFPEIFLAGEHRDMGWLLLGLAYDTRDSQANPYRGWFVKATVDSALAQTDGDVGALFSVAGGRVFPLPGLLYRSRDFPGEENPPTDTLSLGLRGDFTAGDLPFYSLPALGGRFGMRGFVFGRFRDRARWYGRAEYRFWVLPRGFGFSPTARIERVGLAAFYEAGSVAGDGAQLFHAQVQHSYGASVVFSVERAVPFRLNFGFSKDGFEFSAGAGLAF